MDFLDRIMAYNRGMIAVNMARQGADPELAGELYDSVVEPDQISADSDTRGRDLFRPGLHSSSGRVWPVFFQATKRGA